MADVAIWVVSVLTTLLALVLGCWYLKARSNKCQLQQQQQPLEMLQQRKQKGDPASITEEHSLFADEDDTSEDTKTQSITDACDDAENPSAAEHKIGAWPIGMLLVRFP